MSTQPYAAEQPERSDIDRLQGAAVLEFGANWCGICAAAQPLISQALADKAGLRHIKVEDGSGRPLGRSFGVKLWPTLVFLQDGKEVARVVRPGSAQDVSDGLAKLTT
ncbi:thioredoxin family protein [Variovorax dokdonensis]|uniref:Thioredoxin family protein n=1 Tax=Variovorax dokdonensis TaxID=344883 RepID=A0ABT7N8B0_9BURK|nr:thioredoxin family protein [Variovorax dokdonensis]MDM0044169.1 thioredoxin family protein [Variovorax dokdonensis]